MKYFTADWAWGDFTAAESDRVIENYNRDLAAAFDAESNIGRFAYTVSLNDAYVDRVSFDPQAGQLDLLLLTGSLQTDYWHTRIFYRGVGQIVGRHVLKAVLAARPTEICYNELRREGSEICHAFLLTPDAAGIDGASEFAIHFQEFDYTQTRASDRELLTADDRSDWGGQ